MNDLPLHVGLFLLAGSIIVVVSAMFAEPEDDKMLKVLPRRLMTFFLGCVSFFFILFLPDIKVPGFLV